MDFTPTLDMGNVLTIITMIAALYSFHRTNTRRINQMEFKVTLMWKRFAHRFNLDEDLEDEDK